MVFLKRFDSIWKVQNIYQRISEDQNYDKKYVLSDSKVTFSEHWKIRLWKKHSTIFKFFLKTTI